MKWTGYLKRIVAPRLGITVMARSIAYTPGRGRTTTVTESGPSLVQKTESGNVSSAKTVLSGEPCRTISTRGWLTGKVTTESSGGIPDISRTKRFEAGSTCLGMRGSGAVDGLDFPHPATRPHKKVARAAIRALFEVVMLRVALFGFILLLCPVSRLTA